MKTRPMAFLFFGVLTLLFGVCQTTQVAQAAAKPKSVNLKPHQSHEECAEVTPNNELTYSFMAMAPVDFNIHYHEGGKVTYPVQKKKVASDSGVFRPDKKALYCLMWTNPKPENVNVTYSFHVSKR